MFTGGIAQDTVQTTDKSFQALGLSDPILAVLGRIGFEHPTPIQVDSIPPALEGRDVIGLAQTGSGKTAGFGLPIIERIRDTAGQGLHALVISPTREIAQQTDSFFQSFRGLGIDSVCIIGGAGYKPQIDGLRRGANVIVATPGRLLDHMERGNVNVRNLEFLVIDEADHMLDLGFLPQINRILEQLPAERQTMMFSATMPGPVEGLVYRFMDHPLRVDLRPDRRAAEGIEHRLYLVYREDKRDCLLSLVQEEEGSMLVFVRRKVDAEWVCRDIEAAGHEVERMHGDLSQAHRQRALRGARAGEHRVLVATDVAARGLDIPIIEHIVNFDLPQTVEDYIHRAGRTARGSAAGVVSSIATWQDKPMIKEIEAALEQELPRSEAAGVKPYEELPHVKRKTIKGRKRIKRRML